MQLYSLHTHKFISFPPIRKTNLISAALRCAAPCDIVTASLHEVYNSSHCVKNHARACDCGRILHSIEAFIFLYLKIKNKMYR